MWFAEDGDFINVEQAVFRGRKGIEEHLVPMFAGRLKNAHRTYAVKSIRSLRKSRSCITGTKGIDGADVALRKGLYDCVVTERNGKWLINVLQESEHERWAKAVQNLARPVAFGPNYRLSGNLPCRKQLTENPVFGEQRI
jgi:uncharacterized protein (TIGR02246 family)